MKTSILLSVVLLGVVTLPYLTLASTSCQYICTPVFSSTVDSQCLNDCASCARTVANTSCSVSFNPNWNTFSSSYNGFSCNKHCPVEWWVWLLVALGSLLVAGVVGFACFRIMKSRRQQAEAQAAAYQMQAQAAQGVPPPGQYGDPPPGQYGAPPPGQYGAPPPGQYGYPPQ